MKSDIEIARSIELKKIKQVAEGIGIPREEVENYGRYIADVYKRQALNSPPESSHRSLGAYV